MKQKANEEVKLFGENLLRLRLKRGFSQEQVARSIGVAASTYREWESGRAITGLPYRRLAQAFNVSLLELFNTEGNPTSVLMAELTNIEISISRLKNNL